MYIRQAKQFLRNVDSSFDERKFGFAASSTLMRACQREGCSGSSGIGRASCGCSRATSCRRSTEPITARPEPDDDDSRGNVAEPGERQPAAWQDEQAPMSTAEAEVVDGDVVQEDGDRTGDRRRRSACGSATRRRAAGVWTPFAEPALEVLAAGRRRAHGTQDERGRSRQVAQDVVEAAKHSRARACSRQAARRIERRVSQRRRTAGADRPPPPAPTGPAGCAR